MDIVAVVGWAGVGYLLGSFPFAIWITRLFTGHDVRESGSGHAGTTNTIRQAGWPAGVVVFIFDTGKGFLAVWLALRFGQSLAAVIAAGVGAAAGHCWPWLAGFRGGMGLATSAGAMLAFSPAAVAVGIVALLLLLLITRHAARAVVIAAPIIPGLYGLLGWAEASWFALGLAVIAAVRFVDDWNRVYQRLWLER